MPEADRRRQRRRHLLRRLVGLGQGREDVGRRVEPSQRTGAAVSSDGGAPLVHISSAGMRNSPAEVWEVRHAMMIDRLEYAVDSAGAGRYRGGLGIHQHYRALEDCYMTTTFERTRTAPWGLTGGEPGQPNRGAIRSPDGRVVRAPRRRA